MNLNGYNAISGQAARINEAGRLRQAEVDRTTRRLRREAREARSASRIAILLRGKRAFTGAPLAPTLAPPAPAPAAPAPAARAPAPAAAAPADLVPQPRLEPGPSPAAVEM